MRVLVRVADMAHEPAQMGAHLDTDGVLPGRSTTATGRERSVS